MWVQQEVLSPGHRAPPPATHTQTQILSQHLPHHPESLPRPVTCRAEGQKQEFITKHHSFALKPAVPPPGSRITQHGSSPGSAAALPHPRLLPTPSTAVPEGEKSGPGPRSEPEPEPVLGPALPRSYLSGAPLPAPPHASKWRPPAPLPSPHNHRAGERAGRHPRPHPQPQPRPHRLRSLRSPPSISPPSLPAARSLPSLPFFSAVAPLPALGAAAPRHG